MARLSPHDEEVAVDDHEGEGGVSLPWAMLLAVLLFAACSSSSRGAVTTTTATPAPTTTVTALADEPFVDACALSTPDDVQNLTGAEFEDLVPEDRYGTVWCGYSDTAGEGAITLVVDKPRPAGDEREQFEAERAHAEQFTDGYKGVPSVGDGALAHVTKNRPVIVWALVGTIRFRVEATTLGLEHELDAETQRLLLEIAVGVATVVAERLPTA